MNAARGMPPLAGIACRWRRGGLGWWRGCDGVAVWLHRLTDNLFVPTNHKRLGIMVSKNFSVSRCRYSSTAVALRGWNGTNQ